MKKLFIVALLSLTLLSLAPVQKTEAFFFPKPIIKPRFEPIDVDGNIKERQHQLKVVFSNLKYVNHVDYEITYKHNGNQEGITGSFDVNGEKKVVEEFMLGTCSSGGNCVYHKNINYVKAKVTTSYKSPFNKTETRIFLIH